MEAGFSWQTELLIIQKKIIQQNKQLAKSGNNDMKKDHPDWVRDAQKGNYIQLEAETKKTIKQHQELAKSRRLKQPVRK